MGIIAVIGSIVIVILVAGLASSLSSTASSTAAASGTNGSTPGAAQVAPTPPPIEANFKVVHVSHSDDCTQLGDYCIRASCTYLNIGNGPGDKGISSALLDAGVPVATRESTLTLMPQATKEVTFNFPEAELDDGNTQHHYTVRCSSE